MYRIQTWCNMETSFKGINAYTKTFTHLPNGCWSFDTVFAWSTPWFTMLHVHAKLSVKLRNCFSFDQFLCKKIHVRWTTFTIMKNILLCINFRIFTVTNNINIIWIFRFCKKVFLRSVLLKVRSNCAVCFSCSCSLFLWTTWRELRECICTYSKRMHCWGKRNGQV